MSDEKFELDETLFWENDPPENEDDEPSEGAEADDGEGEDDPLAPTGEGDIKPPGSVG